MKWSKRSCSLICLTARSESRFTTEATGKAGVLILPHSLHYAELSGRSQRRMTSAGSLFTPRELITAPPTIVPAVSVSVVWCEASRKEVQGFACCKCRIRMCLPLTSAFPIFVVSYLQCLRFFIGWYLEGAVWAMIYIMPIYTVNEPIQCNEGRRKNIVI